MITILPGPAGIFGAALLAGAGILKSTAKAFTNISSVYKAAADQSKAEFQRANDSLSKYLQSLDKFNSAIADGKSSAEKITKLQNDLAESMAGIPAVYKKQILAAKDATAAQEEVAKVQKRIMRDNQQKQISAQVAESIDKETGLTNFYGVGGGKGSIFESGGTDIGELSANIFKNLDLKALTDEVAKGNNALAGSQRKVVDGLAAQFNANTQLSGVLRAMDSDDFHLLSKALEKLTYDLADLKKTDRSSGKFREEAICCSGG